MADDGKSQKDSKQPADELQAIAEALSRSCDEGDGRGVEQLLQQLSSAGNLADGLDRRLDSLLDNLGSLLFALEEDKSKSNPTPNSNDKSSNKESSS
jgi:hypothetical protein